MSVIDSAMRTHRNLALEVDNPESYSPTIVRYLRNFYPVFPGRCVSAQLKP